jgi:hypothetical protein
MKPNSAWKAVRDHFQSNYYRFFILLHNLFGIRFVEYYVNFWRAIGFGWCVEEGWVFIVHHFSYRRLYLRWALKNHRASPKSRRNVIRLIEAQILAREFGLARETMDTIGNSVFAETRASKTQLDKLRDLRQIIEIEEGAFQLAPASLIGSNAKISSYCYKRAWEMHSMLIPKRMLNYLRLYLAAENYIPAAVDYVVNTLLRDNELHQEIINVVDQTLRVWRPDDSALYSRSLLEFFQKADVSSLHTLRRISDGRDQDLSQVLERLRLAGQRARYFVEHRIPQDGKVTSVSDAAARIQMQYLHALEAMHEQRYADGITILNTNIALVRAMVEVDETFRRKELQATYHLMAQIFERMRNFDSALFAYRRASEFTLPSEWLDGSSWLYVSGLMARQAWKEASAIMRVQLVGFWASFADLSRPPIRKRLARNQLIPRRDSVILGGRGIGDEIHRLVLLRGVRWPGQRFYYSVDPRLVKLLQPGNDWVTFLPASRFSGAQPVSEMQFWVDREGVSSRYDPNRITADVMKQIKRLKSTLTSEDVMVEGLSHGQAFKTDPAPMIVLTKEERQRARDWLDTLPGKLKIGISWRSGEVNLVRNYSYKALIEFGPLFEIGDIAFVNLQYSDTSAECAAVKQRYGIDIHTMPGVDLRDDLREICALAAECDVVIAPCTAVREMAGAAGANVWSLTVTPFLPDLWRLMPDGKTDRYMPSIRHFTSMEHGDSDSVVLAMAEEARRLMASPSNLSQTQSQISETTP